MMLIIWPWWWHFDCDDGGTVRIGYFDYDDDMSYMIMFWPWWLHIDHVDNLPMILIMFLLWRWHFETEADIFLPWKRMMLTVTSRFVLVGFGLCSCLSVSAFLFMWLSPLSLFSVSLIILWQTEKSIPANHLELDTESHSCLLH